MSRKSRFLLALAILAGVLGFRAWQHQAQQKALNGACLHILTIEY